MKFHRRPNLKHVYIWLLPLLLMRSESSQPPVRPTLHFDGHRALNHVEAQMHWQPKIPGTLPWQQTGDYIRATLLAAGWQVTEEPFLYRGIWCRNIRAERGTGSRLLLGAHYDTRGRADRDPDLSNQAKPVPGANDGASGVAVLLELAQALATTPLSHTVELVFFDAEDQGDIDGWEWTVGSRIRAAAAPRPDAVIVVDMVGQRDLTLHLEGMSDQALRTAIWATAAQLGYTQFIPKVRHTLEDDHTPFLQRGIPAIDIIDSHYPQWHTTNDTLDQVSFESLEAVGQTLEAWLLATP